MFTGIVEESGLVRELARKGDVMRLAVGAAVACEGSDPGASVAVNGVCLTVVARAAGELVFELGPETLARTALGRLAAGHRVNLERPLRADSRLGGHFVQGHVDATGHIEGLRGDTDLTERIKCDLWYLENWHPWLDVQIMLMTFIKRENAC